MTGSTQLIPVNMQPGIMRDTTSYMAEGGYVDGNWIRFRQGNPQKRGGFVRETVAQKTNPTNTLFTGVSRSLLAWTDLASKKYLSSAGNAKVELMYNNQIYDITPFTKTDSLSNPLSTTNAQSVVTVHDVANGVSVGDTVVVNSQSSPIAGITLSGAYVVTVVVDTDNYKIDSGVSASSTVTGGGSTVSISYCLPVGPVDNGNNAGWGGGTWGTPGLDDGGWGQPRNGPGGLPMRQWSQDNWGEDLIANPRGGAIYQWVAANGPEVRLQTIENSPTHNSFILVAEPVRILVAFGSIEFASGLFDPMIIRWASQETLTDWDITDVNGTAGEYRLPNGNQIIGACQTKGEIVVFTDTTVYSMNFIGGEDIFQFTPLGTNISCVSQHAYIDVNGTIMWMGVDGFYTYTGVVNILPNTLNRYLFDQMGEGRINKTQKEKTYCAIIKEFNEVMWIYPDINETEVGHYVKYNYQENVWDYGTLDRTTWLDRGTFPNPYAISSGGRLYIEESGVDADGAPQPAFITTAYFDIADGTQLLFVDRILPDVTLPDSNTIQITVYTKRYPHPQAEVTTKGPYYFNDSDDKISFRARGRQMSIMYSVNSTGANFELGKVRIGIQQDGGR